MLKFLSALSLSILVLLFTGSALATPIYVDCQAPGPTHDGTTWDTAYLYLTDSLAVAGAGAQVWVAECAYYPDEGAGRINNDASQHFDVPDGVEIYGGFVGADRAGGGETALDQRDWATHATILSGDIEKNDVNADGNLITETWSQQVGTNSWNVLLLTGRGSATRLDGFVITAGSATGGPFEAKLGGGIFSAGSSANFHNLKVLGNEASWYGGGMLDYDSSSHVENVTFAGNYIDYSAGMGGGFCHFGAGHSVLIDVTFDHNMSAGDAGGAGFQNGSGRIIRGAFGYNHANHYGGGFSATPGTVDLTDVIFTNNSSGSPPLVDGQGGGMYMAVSGTYNITNAVFMGNYVVGMFTHGGGIYANGAGHVSVLNAKFFGNRAWVGGGFATGDPQTWDVTNSVFFGNSVTNLGGGVYNNAGGIGHLTNVTFNANVGGAIFNWTYAPDPPTQLFVKNSIFWGDVPFEILNDGGVITVEYSDVQGGVWPGAGNISADPLIIDPVTNPHPAAASPAIDAGNNDAVPADLRDLDADGDTTEKLPFDLGGGSRFVDMPNADTGSGTPPIVDMGAAETSVEECVPVDDGNACTTDICVDGVPVNLPVDTDDGDACTIDSCDPGTGLVSHEQVPTDDGNPCTVDFCDPFMGVIHEPVNPDDGNACTTESCDPATGVIVVPVPVDDGDLCTVDYCVPTSGVVHEPIDVDDADACTIDTCDPATGVNHTPVPVDDENLCTTDSCDPATGVIHTEVPVDDSNACTYDSCDPATGVTHTPVPVDDGDACTTEYCHPILGVVVEPVPVDDGNACTIDYCDSATGEITHSLIAFDDGNACTNDYCDPATGMAIFEPVPVDDGNACTMDFCDSATGVVHQPVDPDDGDPCTIDMCNPATGVVHGPVNVDDLNACTIDFCDPWSGVIHVLVNPDDGDVCTIDGCDPSTGVFHTPVIPTVVPVTAGDPQDVDHESGDAVTFCAAVEVPDGTAIHVTVNGVTTGAPAYTGDVVTSDSTACVTFDVPDAVDVYEVTFASASCLYSGAGSTVLVVYDPDAGFVTGGGQFLYPGTNDRVNFGLTYSVSGRKAALRGNLLAIRHLENGDVCRAKTNGLGAPAVVDTTATFSGKGNYVCTRPDGTTYDGAGNLMILGYVEDNGEPATGEDPDRIWLYVPATDSMILMNKPAAANAVELLHGNIQVPHKRK